jgi:Gpi18-like mannosyltransferase
MPASWLDSAVWGQTDSFYSLLLLAAFAAIGFRRGVLAGVAVGLAVTAKFQVVAFLPLIAVLAASIDRRMFVKGFVASIVTVLAVFAPFIIAGKMGNIIREYSQAPGSYQLLSVDAFNFWHLLFGEAASATSNLDTFAGLTFRTWGTAAYLLALAMILVVGSRAVRNALDDRQRVEAALASAAMTSLAFFWFPTEIHERYLFPFLALAALWGTSGRREMVIYLVLSLAVGLNIAYSLPISVTDAFFRVVPAADRLVSLVIVIAGIAASAGMIRRLREEVELVRPV